MITKTNIVAAGLAACLTATALLPADVSAASLFKHPKKWAKSVVKSAGRDVNNTIRLITEGRCDREGRKHGREAKARCEAESKNQNPPTNSQSARPASWNSYYAALEVDCWKSGHSTRWGTTTISQTSNISIYSAMDLVMARFNRENVCQRSWNDRNLRDGGTRWVHN